jgi:hypothetical protein
MATTVTKVKWFSDVQRSQLCLTSGRLNMLPTGGHG